MSDVAQATERLYYTDSYASEFSATVVDRAEDGKRVYLDRTAFYPTSGGQPHDLGTIDGIQVVDVVDEDARVAHILAARLTTTGVVNGTIDWARRFDNMQQHTGQHLLSAVFEDLFGAKTVSVHFGDLYSTLDVEVDSLSMERLEKAERRANEVIGGNRPVNVGFEDAATAKGLRKAVDREGMLRIVTIADLDRSACGGTHVRSTGEIGCVLLRGVERIRTSMRVEFVCGLRAVSRARVDYLALTGIASALSASTDNVGELVASQSAALKESDQTRRKLERDLAAYRAKELFSVAGADTSGKRVVYRADASDTMDSLRTLGQAALDNPQSVFVATTAAGGILIAATEDSGVDAGKLIREALGSVGGKGGGSPRLAQGSAPSPELASEALGAIRSALAPDR